jgi:molecular chaperone GrpE (heat shock protein)
MTQGTDRVNDAANDTTHSASRRGRSAGAAGGLLVGSAFLLWCAAAAAVAVPRLAPQYGWVFKLAAKHGVTGGPLALCGVCVWGLGLVARAIARSQRDDQDESRERLRFDQLTGALSLVREKVDATEALLTRVHETAQSALEIAQNEQSNAAAQNRQDAIFRLAASLDQVGARLDQRMQTQQAAIETALQDTAKSLRTALDDINEVAHSRPAVSPNTDLLERAIDRKRSAAMRSDSAGTIESSLGVLDTLDDFGMAQSDSKRTIARERTDVESPSAPLPRETVHSDSSAPARRISNGTPEALHIGEGDEFSTRDKLELLRALMDDVRVREALGGLTGVGS